MPVHLQPQQQYQPGPVQDKVHAIYRWMVTRWIERQDLAELFVTLACAGQNVLTYGPPGTAKTDIGQGFGHCIDGAMVFTRQLHPTMPVESLVGPVDIVRYKQDSTWAHATKGRMPEAHVIILEELGRASGASYDAILSIANEGWFDNNGGTPMLCPRIIVMGTSNTELSNDETGAFTDRFTGHIWVDAIQDSANFMRLLEANFLNNPAPSMTLDELAWAVQVGVPAVKIPPVILEKLAGLRQQMRDEKIQVSDRRWFNLRGVLQAHAFVGKRDIVVEDDIEILRYCLTADQGKMPKVHEKVAEFAGEGAKQAAKFASTVAGIRKELTDVMGAADDVKARRGAAIMFKIATARKLLDAAIEKADRENRDSTKLVAQLDTLSSLKRELKSKILDPDDDA